MNTYEKKHKEEVVRATQLWECGDITRENLEYIFPELAESEEERIRKEIIDFIYDKTDTYELREKSNSWLAWLEKQTESYETKAKLFLINKGYPIDANGGFPTYEEIYDIIRMGLEHQSEQKPFDYENANIKQKDFAPKIGPKFKVGDMITHNTANFIFKIINVGSNGYEVVNKENYKKTISFDNEDNYHLWNISDARDGDVLCTYECDEPKIVFIIKGTPKKHYALSYHCYYNIMYPHFGSDSEKGCLAPNDEDVKPATKEQRDTLFAKMREAGYEFDAIKKEVKKIQQKFAEWREEDEIRLNRICKFLWKNRKGDTDEIFQQEQDVDWLKTLKQRMEK